MTCDARAATGRGDIGTRREGTPAPIAFFIDELRLGGTEKQLLEMIRRLDTRRFAPRLYCLRGEPPAWAERIPCPWQILGVRSLASARGASALLRMAIDLARRRIRIVQTVFFDATVFGVIAARLARVPRVVCMHRDMGFWYTPRLIAWLRRIARWADRHVANAGAIAARIRETLGIDADRIEVLPNGMDLEPFRALPSRGDARRAFMMEPAAPFVGLLANLNRPVKRPDLFVEAAAIAGARHPELRFAILGDGSLRPGLEERARALGIAHRLSFLGQRPSSREFVAALDIGVCPSDSEGLSNAILELEAAGVPVVATRTGGNPEIVLDAVTGILVEPGSASRLAEAISRLLADPALARRLGAAGREMVFSRFGWDAAVAAMEVFYDRLMHGEGSRDGRRPNVRPDAQGRAIAGDAASRSHSM
ncbi:MAG: glycosyltransferase [Planctomycetes bacterium]|nr:glycosyltransferase [Planctomycetota bacterium]